MTIAASPTKRYEVLWRKSGSQTDEQYVKDTLRVHTIVEVETQDGKIYKADVPIPLGHPDNPMSWEKH